MITITKKIKALYKTKANFCVQTGHKYKDFADKLRTLQNKIDWINNFLTPLGMEVIIKEKTADK